MKEGSRWRTKDKREERRKGGRRDKQEGRRKVNKRRGVINGEKPDKFKRRK